MSNYDTWKCNSPSCYEQDDSAYHEQAIQALQDEMNVELGPAIKNYIYHNYTLDVDADYDGVYCHYLRTDDLFTDIEQHLYEKGLLSDHLLDVLERLKPDQHKKYAVPLFEILLEAPL